MWECSRKSKAATRHTCCQRLQSPLCSDVVWEIHEGTDFGACLLNVWQIELLRQRGSEIRFGSQCILVHESTGLAASTLKRTR